MWTCFSTKPCTKKSQLISFPLNPLSFYIKACLLSSYCTVSNLFRTALHRALHRQLKLYMLQFLFLTVIRGFVFRVPRSYLFIYCKWTHFQQGTWYWAFFYSSQLYVSFFLLGSERLIGLSSLFLPLHLVQYCYTIRDMLVSPVLQESIQSNYFHVSFSLCFVPLMHDIWDQPLGLILWFWELDYTIRVIIPNYMFQVLSHVMWSWI